MKKKLSVMLAMVLGALSISAPLQVSADEYRVGEYYDPLTIQTDLFTYEHGSFQRISEDAIPFDNFSIVTGVCYQENEREPCAYIVIPYNRTFGEWEHFSGGGVLSSDKLILKVSDTNGFLDGKTLQIGDVFSGGYICPEEMYPGRMKIFSTPEFIGNVADILGEEAVTAVRHELAENILSLSELFAFDERFAFDGARIDDSAINKGDTTADEQVNIADVLATNQYLLGIYQPSNYGVVAGDVNHNGRVEDADALKILKSVVGLETLE